MSKLIDLTGQQFGLLTVLEQAPSRHDGYAYWLCQCDCGSTIITCGTSLRKGKTRSCGCLRREHLKSIPRALHGWSKTRLHNTWEKMLQRCENPKHRNYVRYGGRGIQVCSQWHDFCAFREWALSNGYAEDLTIDRIDVNGHYEPNNCRWVSQKIQQRNRTNNRYITFDGERRCLTEWAELADISCSALSGRLNRGWSIEDALIIPIKQKRPKP